MSQQLIDYVNQQVKAGVPKENIKAALLGAGWNSADVEEALRGGTPSAEPATAASPAAVSVVAAGQEPNAPSNTSSLIAEVSIHKFPWATVAMGTVIVLLLGAGVFLYMNLTDKAEMAVAENNASSAKISGLENQTRELGAANEGFKSQVASLTQENQALLTELSFLVASPSASSSATSSQSSASAERDGVIRGTLGAGSKVPYILTTAHGVKIGVKNYKDEKVAAALKPLLGGNVELGGTYVTGSGELTVKAVNGAIIQ